MASSSRPTREWIQRMKTQTFIYTGNAITLRNMFRGRAADCGVPESLYDRLDEDKQWVWQKANFEKHRGEVEAFEAANWPPGVCWWQKDESGKFLPLGTTEYGPQAVGSELQGRPQTAEGEIDVGEETTQSKRKLSRGDSKDEALPIEYGDTVTEDFKAVVGKAVTVAADEVKKTRPATDSLVTYTPAGPPALTEDERVLFERDMALIHSASQKLEGAIRLVDNMIEQTNYMYNNVGKMLLDQDAQDVKEGTGHPFFD